MIKINLAGLIDERMTQIELSRKTGIRPATINQIYHGEIDRINLKYLSKLCEVLDCQVQDILEYVPDDEHIQYGQYRYKK